MSDAREKAVERLILVLGAANAAARDGVEIERACREVCSLSALEVRAAMSGEPYGLRDAAENILRGVGLVAVPAEIVERLDAHPATVEDEAGRLLHSADAPDCGYDGTCKRCLARLALADAVLAQLKGDR